jgi:hypothetical protein
MTNSSAEKDDAFVTNRFKKGVKYVVSLEEDID